MYVDALALLVPAVATAALGGALLVPIRDGRAGRKATIDGRSPLFTDFRNVDPAGEAPPAQSLVSPRDFDPLAIVRSVARRFRPATCDETTDQPCQTVGERSFADELAILLPIAAPSPVPLPVSERSDLADVADVADVAPISLLPAAVAETSPDRDVLRAPFHPGRVVPLTRLPLRHRTTNVTWPAHALPAKRFATASERYAFLRGGALASQGVDDALLARAFREETPEGRSLVLAALRRPDASRDAIDTFAQALATGVDEERALAIDALGEAGAREEIALGIVDRVDAIAAQAALAYVGTTAREDYRAALAPFIDEARIATLLSLLAGILE